ncbi:MAG: hypothetical protein ACYDCO_01510 [Armatimonadota bacterium]
MSDHCSVMALRLMLSLRQIRSPNICRKRESLQRKTATILADLSDQSRAELWAMDMFTVPTLLLQVLYVLVVVRHDRRRIQHIAFTLHPTAEWIVQQLREATPFGEQPMYLLHDNGAVFVSAEVRQLLWNAGMKSAGIAYRRLSTGIVGRRSAFCAVKSAIT